jgi:probable rRNA maturation factor
MEIDVSCQDVSCSEPTVQEVARQTLIVMQLQDVMLSILLCNDQFIHPLNREYRGKDYPTDVLSFSQREGEFAFDEDAVLGDVIISVETALRQAEEKKHSFGTEMEILLVHGILHLLGYDHVDDDDASVMQAKEQEILDQIQVKW